MSISRRELMNAWSAQPIVKRPWLAYALITGCALASFFLLLGAIPLTSPNEGLYAEVAREMLEGKSSIVPRANGVIYLEKPPLLYWMAALSMRLLGVSAFAARLPSAVAALVTAWLLVAAGRRWGPRRAGQLAGVIFATSMGLVIVARQVLFDSMLTLWITLALLSFWFGTEPREAERHRRALLAVGYAALALGILTKGLVALALSLLTIAAYAVLAKDFTRLRAAWSPAGIALFLAIALPWHLAAATGQKGFARFYFINEHWLRFLGRRQPADFHEDPLLAPGLSLILLTLPWGFFLPAALRSEQSSETGRKLPPETLFLLCWAVVPALFFTLSRTRTYYYQLPSVPALSLLLGRLWARLTGKGPQAPRERWILFSAGALALLVAAAWLFAAFGTWGSLREAAWHALAFACGGWLVAGLAASLILIAARREAAAFGVVAAAVVLTVIAAVRFAAARPESIFPSEEAVARLIVGLSPPEGTLVAVEGKFENHSSLAFYLPRRLRPLLVVDARGQGDLGFGDHLEDRREIFVSTPMMFDFAETKPVFYLTKSPSRLRIPPKLNLLDCNDEIMLWTNLPEATAAK